MEAYPFGPEGPYDRFAEQRRRDDLVESGRGGVTSTVLTLATLAAIVGVAALLLG